jgi:hypothetical protein
MERRSKLLIAKTAVAMAAIPFIIYAYEYGPDAGVAGVPGENGTCAQVGCHTGTQVNPDGGSVTVSFANGLTYAPGVKQHLVVTIDDSKQKKWGFELTARTADATVVAGTFSPTDNRTQLMCSSADFVQQINNPTACPSNRPLVYIEHTLAGYNANQTSPGKYEFDWTPPATDVGPITIYVGANAANGDLTSNGDRIYTATYTLTNQPACSPGAPTVSSVTTLNPGFTPQSWISIKGCNLAGSTRFWTSSDFTGSNVPTKLDDVTVSVDGQPASIEYASPTQLVVWSASTTPASLTVSNGQGTSDSFTVSAPSAKVNPSGTAAAR